MSKTLLYANGSLPFKLIVGNKSPYVNVCQILGSLVNSGPCTPVDRTSTFPSAFNMKVLDPIPSLPSTYEKSFAELCDERAAVLVALNKPISVLWSGGLDSTCVLVALLKAAPNASQIRVLFERRAIDEYPYFFERHIRKVLNYRILNEYFAKYKPSSNEILTSGALGGELFGSFNMLTKNFERRFTDWKDAFFIDPVFDNVRSGFTKNFLSDDNNKKWIVERVEEQVRRAPMEIKSILDLNWWLLFSVRWQSVRLRIGGFVTHLSKREFNNIQALFNTEEFQQWAMSNREAAAKYEPATYKNPMKDYIYDYTKDADYRDNKTPDSSGDWKRSLDQTVNTNVKKRMYFEHPGMRVIVDEEFNNYTNEDLKAKPALFNEFATPEFLHVLRARKAPNENWLEI